MCTVNGILTVDEGLQLQVPALNRKVEFALADDSPPILSVGKRCMQDGYSFFWPRGKDPYLVDQYNNIIKLTVENFVPYIAHSTDGAATAGVERGTSSDDPKGSTVARVQDLLPGELDDDEETAVEPSEPCILNPGREEQI